MMYPFYDDSRDYTPNRATWLFVLIYRFRKLGHSYETALAMARAKLEASP